MGGQRSTDLCAGAIRKLQQAMKLVDTEDDLKAEILLDLHFNTLLFAQEQGFSLEKISTLISLVKAVLETSTGKRQTLKRSWEHAKSLLLMHTVQRPPFSMAMFSLADLQMITQYLLHTYYKHYKLYQYAFTPNYILDLEQITNDDIVELPAPIPPLNEAKTHEERDADLLNLQRELEEIERKICQSEVLAREAAIAASIEAAYRAAIPDEVSQAAAEAVTKHMEKMRADIEEKLQETEEKITGKILSSPDLKARNDKETPAGKNDKKTAGGKTPSEKKAISKDEKKPPKGK